MTSDERTAHKSIIEFGVGLGMSPVQTHKKMTTLGVLGFDRLLRPPYSPDSAP